MAINIPNFIVNTFTITSGQTTSDALDLQGRGILQLVMPAAFTGTAMSFLASYDGTNYQAPYNTSNTQLTMTVAASRTYVFIPMDMISFRWLKLVSGSSEGGTRSIIVVSRELS